MPSNFDPRRNYINGNGPGGTPESRASKRKVRNILTVSGKGVRGRYPSRKASEHLKFESLVEEAVLRVCDIATLTEAIATQPCVINLPGAPTSLRYTPDIEISIKNKRFYIEVKANRSLRNTDVVARLQEITRRMRGQNTPLIWILESDVRAKGLQEELTELQRLRPAPGRYRADLDTSLWDPLCRYEPSTELLRRWHAAQRTCDALLERVIRRDPDDLLAEEQQ